jgi:hypothetical protein
VSCFPLEHVDQDASRKHIHTHRRHERPFVGVIGERRAVGDAASYLAQTCFFRLLLEGDDRPLAIEAEDTHLRRRLHVHRLSGNRDVGFLLTMRLDQLFVVHPVQMIAGEDQVVLGVVLYEMPRRLPDGISRALIPVGIVGRLLGGEDLDEPTRETVKAIGIRDVTIE